MSHRGLCAGYFLAGEPCSAGLLSHSLPERRVQARMQIRRQRNRLGITENLDAFFRLVQDHRAVFTVLEMPLELLFDCGLQLAINVVRQLVNDAFAVQFRPPWRKCRLSLSLSLRRARRRRDLTALTDIPSASAVSCVESSSTSRKAKTIRYSGSSLSTAWPRICCISACAYSLSGLGRQSSSSLGIKSLSPSRGSSSENCPGRRFRRRIRASFAAILTSQV